MTISPQVIIEKTLKEFFNINWSFKDFLTEDDVRCRLFVSLQNTLQEHDNISVHSEIRWYGNKKNLRDKLKFRSDIVVIDHKDLSVSQSKIFKLRSKGYGFNNYYAIIEIKLRRPNNGSSNSAYDKIIQKDMDKLEKIKEETTDSNIRNKKYFVLVFDKKRKRKQLIDIDNDNVQSVVWDNWTG